MKSKLFILLILCCVLGCSSTRSGSRRNLALENKSSREMHEATLLMGIHQIAFGFLETPFVKVVMGYPKPFTSEAKLTWQCRGVEYEKTIYLGSVVPRSQPGTLFITVYDDRLAARFEADPEPSK